MLYTNSLDKTLISEWEVLNESNYLEYFTNLDESTLEIMSCNLNVVDLVIENKSFNNINSDVTSIFNVLDTAQFNNTENSLVNINSLDQTGSYTFISDTLKAKLINKEPIMASIKSELGNKTVLITSIYQNIENPNIFKLKLYDPSEQSTDCYATLTVSRGINTLNQIGFYSTFEYSSDGIEYTDIYLYDIIEFGTSEYHYTDSLN
jgi:hypothetical protein